MSLRRMEDPTGDGKYYMVVIEDDDEYRCICGNLKCRHEKMISPRDFAIKYNEESKKTHFNYIYHNEYSLYYHSIICRWPVTDTIFVVDDSIVLINKSNGKIYNNRVNAVGKLLSSLLYQNKKERKDKINYCYLYWRTDKDMYMSTLPGDVLRIILDFSMAGL